MLHLLLGNEIIRIIKKLIDFGDPPKNSNKEVNKKKAAAKWLTPLVFLFKYKP